MSLKSLLTEAVVVDSMYDIESELMDIKETILEQMIIEGVDDPGILKCVFMAGGPGSGKSFTAMEIFGIDKKLKSSFSSFGLKSVNSDSAFEKGLKDYGIDPRKLADIEKNDAELWDKLTGKGKDTVRSKAKELTKKQKAFYEAGRLGMIIDGTGHQYGKIDKNKKYAESLGYDTYMVFVNTSLDIALERNRNRPRSIPEYIVQKSWNGVQANIGQFQRIFSPMKMMILDNNSSEKELVTLTLNTASRYIRSQLRASPQNLTAKQWIANELKAKQRT